MTVARAVEQLLPEKRIIYFGDLARTPYGSKSPEAIRRYARQNTEFLLSKGARIVIVACNSAASVAADLLQEEYDVPIFEVISPAIQQAVTQTSGNRIGVIGTRATIKSNVYESKIRARSSKAKVFSKACPLLVPLVEEGWLDKRETKMILRRYLHPLKHKGVDTLVLGCTHYPLLKDLLSPRIGKRVTVIDSSITVASALQDYLQANEDLDRSLAEKGTSMYYVSDVTDAARATARRIFGRDIDLQLVDAFPMK